MSEPLTIDLLFEFPTLNGGENSMLSVIAQTADSAEVCFRAMCPDRGPLAKALRSLGVSITPFHLHAADGTKRDAAELAAELRDNCLRMQTQILHANSLSMSRLIGRAWSESTDRPPVRSGHLRDIIRLSRKAVADLNQNDRLVAVSQATKEFHVRNGLDTSRCSVVHNGVDTGTFRPLDDRHNPRQQLLPSVPDDATVILNVGQICLRKDQLTLAKAVCEMLNDRSDLHLVLVGERHSQKQESLDFEKSISQVFADAGKEDHLHMAGRRSNVEQWMNACDILVHTARQEPFGRVLLESAACGLPIIATDVGGTAEMLTDEAEALLIEPGSPQQISGAIRRLTTGYDLREKLSAAAYLRVTQEFSVQVAAQNLLEFWQSLASECH